MQGNSMELSNLKEHALLLMAVELYVYEGLGFLYMTRDLTRTAINIPSMVKESTYRDCFEQMVRGKQFSEIYNAIIATKRSSVVPIHLNM